MKQLDNRTGGVRAVFPIIVVAQLACTTLWFAGNAVLPDIEYLWHLPSKAHGLILAAVQGGFVAGTLLFSITSLPDRYPAPNVFFVCALLGAFFNASIIAVGGNVDYLIGARFLTGFFLAGIYPVGMKIAASWCENGLGRALGYLVGALVLGTAFPHLVRGLGVHFPWSSVVVMCSVFSAIGGLAIYLFVPFGPYLPVRSALKVSAVVDLIRVPQLRGAACGYFGHMWELYALWAYMPLLIHTYSERHGLSTLNGPLVAFAAIGAGAIGCILGGELAKRIGSARVALGQLLISGLLCIGSPLLLYVPEGLFIVLLVLWGVTAAGDSPQFSSLVGLGAPRQYVGTAFTIVNCVGFSISAISILVIGYVSTRFPPEFLFIALAPGPIFGLVAARGLVRDNSSGMEPENWRNHMSKKQPMILGIGGTLRNGSSSERALNIALYAAEKAGATVRSFTGAKLDLPHYDPSNKAGIEAASELLDLYRQCDGVIISSPGYHGSTSGMIKNALDYIEELRSDERVYLEDRPVGCIVCAYGWQATGTTLSALRSIVHALRGWPTPLGVTINSSQTSFFEDGECSDSRVADQLHALAAQVLGFASQGTPTLRNAEKST